MRWHLPSYEPNGSPCCWPGTKEKPCWGTTSYALDWQDDEGAVTVLFACEGHMGPFVKGGPYAPTHRIADENCPPIPEES